MLSLGLLLMHSGILSACWAPSPKRPRYNHDAVAAIFFLVGCVLIGAALPSI